MAKATKGLHARLTEIVNEVVCENDVGHELQPSCDAQGHHDKYCQMGECQYAEIGLPRCQCHVSEGK